MRPLTPPHRAAPSFEDRVDVAIATQTFDQATYESLLEAATLEGADVTAIQYLDQRARAAGLEAHGVTVRPAPRRVWTPPSKG